MAITAIERYTSGRPEAAFLSDPMLIDAVERNIERISEASRHIPEELRVTCPQIPWREIAGIGNVLRHDYPQVRPREIWETVVRDLPILKEAVLVMLLRNASS